MTETMVLQAQILEFLTTRLRNIGFDSKVRGQSIWRRYPWGRQSVHVSFIEHKDCFDATVDVAVRLDQVEDLVNRANPYLSANEKKATFTVGAELGNLTEGRQLQWTVRGRSDISRVSENIANATELIGIPFLVKYSDPERLYEALRLEADESRLISPVPSARAKQAVALAILLGRNKQIPSLIEEKEKALQKVNAFYLEDFRQFLGSIGERR